MTISEFIKELEKIKAEHGDQNVGYDCISGRREGVVCCS